MIERDALVKYCHTLLNVDQFSDYAPNGLQVEGRSTVQRIVTGVTACQALLEAAISYQTDAILVHHGYFWRGEPTTIVGVRARRIGALLKNDINLLGYHLPLDAHPILGNNVQLAQRLGFTIETLIDDGHQPAFTCIGYPAQALSGEALAILIAERLGRTPLHIAGHAKIIKRVAWCTGAAQSVLPYAVEERADAYITGEISENTVHFARETGTHFYAAGHHATERYGIQALGEHLATMFGLEHHFIDIENPV